MATAKTLTTKQITQLFGVSAMTVSTWRKGTPQIVPLATTPVKGDPRAVAFKVSDVKAWAKTVGRKFLQHMTPEAILENEQGKAIGTASGRISGKTQATSNTPKTANPMTDLMGQNSRKKATKQVLLTKTAKTSRASA